MSVCDRFDLFLFDFDGLLVNTEHLHFQAYVNMMAEQGFALSWNFRSYCELAHSSADGLREKLYVDFPDLNPDWASLYALKKKMYMELLASGKVELMPGVTKILPLLEQKKKRRCVVTHSPLPQIQAIRSQHPILQTIPHWITREDYGAPKPSPEGYLKAITLYGKQGDKIIGFEDSLRGLQALQNTPATPVFISSFRHPLLSNLLEEGVLYYDSFDSFLSGS